MSEKRRRALLIIRALCILLTLLALAGPAKVVRSGEQALVMVLDHSRSMGEEGLERVFAKARDVASALPRDVQIGYVAAGDTPSLLAAPGDDLPPSNTAVMDEVGAQTDLAAAVSLAEGLFPPGTARHVLVIGDGQETQGDLALAARDASAAGLKIHATPVAGESQPDARVTRLDTSQARLSEGASLELSAHIESSIAGSATLRLFENGLEVESREIELQVGEAQVEIFRRTPTKRNIYNYRAVIENLAAGEGDAIPENNEALAIVDVRGKPLLLYVEGEKGEERFLIEAMAREGIRLESRGPEGIPQNLSQLAGYDGIILSDVAAHRIGETAMAAIRDYVEKLGGGFVMIGGTNSFGVGGYYRTPIEEILPVKLKAPDQEEHQSSALALVIDRSGSMSGTKIEMCKAAAIATAEILTKKDYIGVYAFDSTVHVVVPMTRVTSTAGISGQIATLNSGGGTFIFPGMQQARNDLNKVRAKVKHMIVLTDGQTTGQGYEALASQCRSEGMTISTVAVGQGSQIALLQAIAAAGGGNSYTTMDPSAITRIFTQDTMVHTGRMIREEPFEPSQVENHPMLKNWGEFQSPPLLGYVKTNRKATSQIPLVTDIGDPLLAHWRYGLGKVTAFTSDCKSRWSGLWVANWPGYSQLWAQILRETARAPQGQFMDLRIDQEGDEALLEVDLLEDAATRRNDAAVTADIFFIPPNALGSAMQLHDTVTFRQDGPGLYASQFRAGDPGVYLVRARAGAQMVSAGLVHNPSAEVASGQINTDLLQKVTKTTGGQFLDGTDSPLAPQLTGADVSRYKELWPLLALALLALFLADIAIRRWENVRGIGEKLGVLK